MAEKKRRIVKTLSCNGSVCMILSTAMLLDINFFYPLTLKIIVIKLANK